jgi:hypothetical protein
MKYKLKAKKRHVKVHLLMIVRDSTWTAAGLYTVVQKCTVLYIDIHNSVVHTILVRAATSLVYVGIGSMHVVEQHDDLFFWKKYNNYTHV